MNIPLLTYLSVTRQSDDTIELDDNRLQFIRIKYQELRGDNDPDDEQLQQETLKKLINQLQLSDDQVSMEYLILCVSQSSDDGAKLEIKAKFMGSVEYLELSTMAESKRTKKSKKQKVKNELNDNDVQQLTEISCIIHRKLNKPEVNDFIKQFL